MVALVSLPNPFATFISYKAHKTPRITLVRCSIRGPSSSSRRTRRKNYLRPKILRTLTKPDNNPSNEPTVEPIQPVEPNAEVPLELVTEKSDSSFAEEVEMSPGSNESDLSELELVRGVEGPKVSRFNGFSGRTVNRVVRSFVGLVILQAVVAAWIMGSRNSDEKNRELVIEDRKKNLRTRMQGGEVGVNGNALMRNLAGLDVDESEMEAKISEIRKMAWEVREAEKKKKVENGEANVDNLNDDDGGGDDREDVESDSSRINSGILKEVDGRLSKLRKKIPVSSMNVNFVNTSGKPGNEGKDDGLNDKDEDHKLFFKMKQQFRSQLTTPKEKPKGFRSTNGVRDKHGMVDDENPIEKTSTGNDINQSLNDGVGPGKRDDGIDKGVEIPVSQSSKPMKGTKKRSGSRNAEKKLDKGINGFTTSGSNRRAKKLSKGLNEGVNPEKRSTSLESNGAAKKSSKRMNEVAKPERGLVQDSSNGNTLDEEAGFKKSSTMSTSDGQKMNDHVVPRSSEKPSEPGKVSQSHSDKRGSKLPGSSNKGKKENDDPWWSKLPYVLVVLMQKGTGNEAERGFYNIKLDSYSQSDLSYTVAFEDRNDAQNFSYLLESAFDDLPDAAVDIAPLSRKDFKEVVETLENKVIVVRKGELKLYAGQPLAEAEAALRSLLIKH